MTDRPMPPDVAGALMCMAQAFTAPMARHHAARAVAAGASPEVMAEAWDRWHALQAESVVVIESTGGAA